jgi:hypothetical protein
MRNALLGSASWLPQILYAAEAGTGSSAAPDSAAAATAIPAPAEAGSTNPAPSPTPDAASQTAAPAAAAAPSSPEPAKADGAKAPEPAAAPKESTPSLLAGADAAKREGAPEPAPAPAKAADKPEPAVKAEAPPGDKPAEPKADGTAPVVEAPAEKPPAPVYDAFKAPDGFALDDKKVGEFSSMLGEFEVGAKADHVQTQAFGQKLVDFYTSEVQRIGEHVAQHQIDVWNRLNEQRINEFKADPQLGGNRQDTTLGNAKYVIEAFAGDLTKPPGDPSRLSAAQEILRVADAGGVSNFVGFIRLLNNIYERFREPEIASANPAPFRPDASRERGQRGWYDKVDGESGRAA